MAFSRQDLNPPVQRDKASFVLYRETQKVAIRHLAVTVEPFMEWLHRFRESDVHRPKAMARTPSDGSKQFQGFSDTYRSLVEPAIGDDSNETGLRQRARGPVPPG